MTDSPLWRRYLRLWGPDVDADVREELDLHIELRTEELIEGGWAPEPARQEALRLFGDLRSVRKECTEIDRHRQRKRDRLAFLGELRMDLRQAWRSIAKRPTVSVIVIISLALGIGATTAIFTVAKTLFLDRLPVDNPDELVLFNWVAEKWPGFTLSGRLDETEDGKDTSTSFSHAAFRRFTMHRKALSSVFAFAEMRRVNLNLDGSSVLRSGQLVSGSYFPGLGVNPHLGRLLLPSDDRLEAEPAVVLSFSFWRSHCGGDLSMIGRSLTVNGTPFSVVGVAEPGFFGTSQVGSRPSVFVPIAHYGLLNGGEGTSGNVKMWWLQIMGRLAPGATIDQANSMLDPLLTKTAEDHLGRSLTGDEDSAKRVPRLRLTPGTRGLQEVRRGLVSPLMTAVGITLLILVIACSNAATLLLAKAENRRREMAVRVALGAGRMRVARMMLTESLLLAVLSGTLGLALSLWMSRALGALLASGVRHGLTLEHRPDPVILGFAVVVSLLTGLVFGIAPALKAPRVGLERLLRESGGGQVGGTRMNRGVGRVLVAGQVALSLVLLVAAGLFLKTLHHLQAVDPGFEPDGVLTFRVDASLNGYHGEALLILCEQIRDELAHIPGVTSAAMASFSPVTGSGSWDQADVPDGPSVDIYFGAVDPAFFKTLEIDLLSGRALSVDDRQDSPPVAVVNQAFADRAFGTSNPVGRVFTLGRNDRRTTFTVVGVFANGRSVSLRREPGPMAYMPLSQRVDHHLADTFFVRTTGRPEALAQPAREVVRGIEPDLPLYDVRTMTDHVDRAMLQERQFLRLSTIAAAVALILACIGIYGSVSYAVSRRSHEIGIRIALGASRTTIMLSAMREMFVVAIGAFVGLLSTWAVTRFLESLLFGLDAFDVATLAAATVVLISVASVAVFVPAFRASRVEPMKVLRFE